MARENRSPRRLLPGLVTVCVVVLLLAATIAGPSAAEPRLFVSGATKDANTILAGESVNVTATVKNTGDDRGAINIEYKANGSTRATERVVVDPGKSESRSRNLTFDTPGTYQLTVHNPKTSAGRVRVKRAIASLTANDTTSRDIEVRGGAVPTSDPYTISMPADSNRSFTIESWTVDASQESFTQEVTEFTDPEASGLTVPGGDSATVFGMVTVGSTGGVEADSMQFRLDRSNLREAGIAASEVRLYHRVNGSWRAAETTVVEEQTDGIVYEADTSGATAYAIGKMEPSFDITRTSVVSERADAGQRVVVEATITNNGAIEGTYDAQMRVNDEVVNETSVSIPAQAERTVTMTTLVTNPGRFRVGVNDANAGVVQVTEQQVSTDDPDESAETAEAEDTADATEPDAGDGNTGGDSGLGALPATILGIDSTYVIGGLVLALVLFGGLIVLTRNSGGGGSGGFEL